MGWLIQVEEISKVNNAVMLYMAKMILCLERQLNS